MSRAIQFLAAGILTGLVVVVGAQARTFHVDATRGDDGRDGLKPETAWRSMTKVNRAPLAPGDRVLFRRGQTWRGQLVPQSGDASGVITYRRNVIWNSEYSFEYWNRGPASRTRNIVFEHNTCVDAGQGWGHAQRPDPNGRHLMFYDNAAVTTNVVIRYNIFCNATDRQKTVWVTSSARWPSPFRRRNAVENTRST